VPEDTYQATFETEAEGWTNVFIPWHEFGECRLHGAAAPVTVILCVLFLAVAVVAYAAHMPRP